MTLPAATLALFRAQWDLRFTDSVVIASKTGASFSTSSGQETPTYTNRYSGKALYRPSGWKAIDFGERTVTLRTGTVYVPYTTTAVKVGDRVTITSATDSALSGSIHVVRGVQKDTYLTKRAFEVEEVQDA